MNESYEAKKLRLLHVLQLQQSYWQRWTELSYYNEEGQESLTDYAVKKICRELESEGLIYIRMKSTGWFNRYLVRAVDSITITQFRQFHPKLKFITAHDYDFVSRTWSSKKLFYYCDAPIRCCENCIKYNYSVIFGVMTAEKLSAHNPLADIPF